MKKMSIIIDEAHSEKLNAALKESQGKATTRTIDSWEELAGEVAYYTAKIPTIPKKHWKDCRLIIKVGAGHFPHAYKYRPMGTFIEVTFGSDGKGRLTYVDRVNVNGMKPYQFDMTEEAQNSILKALNIF